MDDSAGDGNYTEDHDDGFVEIANELLTKFHLSPIQDLTECTASVLVALYEGILGSRLIGCIPNPITRQDEIHNIQLVIDSLQHDVLRADMSHIKGEAIVDGHLISIKYLLEILAGMLEYLMEQIESEGSTDVEVDTTDDPELMTSGTISSISRVLPDDFSSLSSLSRDNYRHDRRAPPATATRPDDDDDDDHDHSTTSTNELIHLGESAASAYGPNGSIHVPDSDHSSLSFDRDRPIPYRQAGKQMGNEPQGSKAEAVGKVTVTDSTQDMIREGESLAKKYDRADDDVTTSEQDVDIDKPTTTEIVVSQQDASLSMDSSASWPKQPQIPTTKPPSEFDTIGLGLRSRSSVEKDLTVDSFVRGIDRGEKSRSQHVHTHHHVQTHHHYHQPVMIPGGSDPVYASSLPLPHPSSSSLISDIRRRHPTDPLPKRTAATISRTASSSTSHDNVPYRGRHYTSGDTADSIGPLPKTTATISRPASSSTSHDNVPYRARGRPYTSGDIADPIDTLPKTTATISRPASSSTSHDNVPYRARGRPYTSGDIADPIDTLPKTTATISRLASSSTSHDNVPYRARGRPYTSGDIADPIDTLPKTTATISRPASSSTSHDNVPYRARGRHYTSGDIADPIDTLPKTTATISGPVSSSTSHNNVPYRARGRPYTSGDIADPIDTLPKTTATIMGPASSSTSHDNVPYRARGRPYTSGDHPIDPLPKTTARISSFASSTTSDINEPYRVRGRPYTSGDIQDDVPLTGKVSISQHGSKYRCATSRQSPHFMDDLRSSTRIPPISHRPINENNSAKYSINQRFDRPWVSSDRVSSYQADKLATSGDLRHLLSSSRDDQVAGFIPSTVDHPSSLASERYKSYLSSRLKPDDATTKSDQQANISPRLEKERYARTFPQYETIDNFIPARSRVATTTSTSSRQDVATTSIKARLEDAPMPSRQKSASTSKKSSQSIRTSYDSSSKIRQSNLSLGSQGAGGSGGRVSRFPGDRDAEDVGRIPAGRRIAFEDDDEGAGISSISRMTKEVLPPDSDSDLEEISIHSDTEVDYSPVPDRRVVVRREDHDRNLQSRVKRPRSKKQASKPRSVLLPPTSRPSLKVRFEDALDVEAKGEMGKIRKKLQKEKKTQDKKKQVLQTMYASNLREVKDSLKQQSARRKHRMQQEDKQYRDFHRKPKTKFVPSKKYAGPVPAPSRQSRPVDRRTSGKRKRSASSSPTFSRQRRPLHIGDDEMLPTVMQEFPFLHVSPHTAHTMWSKQMRQMEQLTKSGLDLPNKNKTQIKMEEAERRQDVLLNIMKKDMAHNQRMRDKKNRQAAEHAMTSKAREQRQMTARARRYYDEFRLRAKSRMLKRRNREEQIFKKLFEDGLAIQRSRIREMRQYATEKRAQISAREQDEIDSMENYYRDQFSMLAENIAKERHQLQVRDDAQNKVMEQMKREMRRKMEKEIRGFQEQLYRDKDTEYFRQVEADRMRKELQMANYKLLL